MVAGRMRESIARPNWANHAPLRRLCLLDHECSGGCRSNASHPNAFSHAYWRHCFQIKTLLTL